MRLRLVGWGGLRVGDLLPHTQGVVVVDTWAAEPPSLPACQWLCMMGILPWILVWFCKCRPVCADAMLGWCVHGGLVMGSGVVAIVCFVCPCDIASGIVVCASMSVCCACVLLCFQGCARVHVTGGLCHRLSRIEGHMRA